MQRLIFGCDGAEEGLLGALPVPGEDADAGNVEFHEVFNAEDLFSQQTGGGHGCSSPAG
ncbi:hypothetical protein [Solidesulfovibrio fructosivorans]|uniref:hypothetical protein n=1 Tax=Solidesulfovibrio fructosivorans TaxID=878 RepID=UPI0013052DBC|nr:hypothetical protein [Solidesulfovibrio fructosivorans]